MGAVRVFSVVDAVGNYRTRIGAQEVDLPLMPIADDLAIALLITVDHGVRFAERAGSDLAELLAPSGAEVVVTVATMGIPLAIEVTRALGLDDYLILQKTPKIHLQDAISEPVTSITTGSPQRLLFDRARVSVVAGRRVAVVDDVISTGASVRAALSILRRVGAEPVVIGAMLTEAATWQDALGEDAALVRALGQIPVFRRPRSGEFVEDWGGSSDRDIAPAAVTTEQ
ncbi:MAG TPA: phosphoribosyltransferase family protein [Acidimicrobiales bacterium]|nr:phosphoribosyltransferase family protein [Acidimicrobiales bacterium]